MHVSQFLVFRSFVTFVAKIKLTNFNDVRLQNKALHLTEILRDMSSWNIDSWLQRAVSKLSQSLITVFPSDSKLYLLI